MDSTFSRQTQFELFPSGGRSALPNSRPRLFGAPLTLSLENFVILTIVIMMSMVLSFSFGVERGKRFLRAVHPTVPTVTEGASAAGGDVVQASSFSLAQTISESSPAGAVVAPVLSSAVPAVALEPVPVVVSLPPEKSVDNFYTVQVASYKKGDYAKKEAIGLKQKGYDSMVVTKGEHEILCVGKFAVINEAKKFSQKLKKQYKDCLVRRL